MKWGGTSMTAAKADGTRRVDDCAREAAPRQCTVEWEQFGPGAGVAAMATGDPRANERVGGQVSPRHDCGHADDTTDSCKTRGRPGRATVAPAIERSARHLPALCLGLRHPTQGGGITRREKRAQR